MEGSGGRDAEVATLKVVGPKSIMGLRPTFTAAARLDQTWYVFLTANGLQMNPTDNVRVGTLRSRNRCTAATSPRQSWTANLSEKIGTFVHKFQRNKKIHTVRLYRLPGNGNGSGNRVGRKRIVQTQDTYNIYQKPRYTPGYHGTGANGSCARTRQMTGRIVETAEPPAENVRPVAGTSKAVEAPAREIPVAGTTYHIGRIKFERMFEQDGDSGEDGQFVGVDVQANDLDFEVDPNQIEGIAATQQAIGLGPVEDAHGENEGSDVGNGNDQDAEDNQSEGSAGSREDVGLGANASVDLPLNLSEFGAQKIMEIDNNYLLRSRREIEKLKRNGLWIRNYQRAPLSCYLLQQILNIN